MSDQELTRPTYAGAFRCIGPACEDDCCHGWDIPVDKTTFERYQLFPADQLGWAVSGFVSATPAKAPDSLYAQIHMDASGECPFLEADRLCGIQKKYGAELLSSSCSSYPRLLNRVDGVLEGSLSLSCPEAARNVLLDPGFLDRVTDLEAGGFRTDNFFWLKSETKGQERKPLGSFHAVRAGLTALVKDRSRPIWLRIMRVGALCQLLEKRQDADAAIAIVLGGAVDRELLELSANRRTRLEISMRLADERVRNESARRFQETYLSFVEGIAADGVGDDLERLGKAERVYYRPFMDANPHVLENFLLNSFYQGLFPFGRTGGSARPGRGMFEEFVEMATLFGWMEMLLIGVAGKYREQFCGAHVVETVQSFHRSVEHYAGVLENVLVSVAERGMGSLAGMAVMLR